MVDERSPMVMIRLLRAGTFCVSCLAESLTMTRADVMTELSALSGVMAVAFSAGRCARCGSSRGIARLS